MKYMECPYCQEIALPWPFGGECEECNRPSFFHLDDDEQPKDDCDRPRQVVAVIRPKVNWYARWMR